MTNKDDDDDDDESALFIIGLHTYFLGLLKKHITLTDFKSQVRLKLEQKK